MAGFVPVSVGKIVALQQVLSKRLPNSTNETGDNTFAPSPILCTRIFINDTKIPTVPHVPYAGPVKTKWKILISLLKKKSNCKLWNIAKISIDKRYSPRVVTTFFSYNDIIDEEALLFAVQRRQFPTATDELVTISGPANIQNVTSTIIKAFEEAINWTSEIVFCAVDEDLVRHMKLPEMCSRNGTLIKVNPCLMYYCDIECALQLDLDKYTSTGVVVSPLEKDDATIVMNSWKFGGPGTLEKLEDSIETIGSAGVYVIEPSGNKLVSWVTMGHGSAINALYTREEYRRWGYGRIATEAVCRYAAEKGLIPSGQIELENQASKALIEKLGGIYSHQIDFVIYHPLP